MYKQGTMNAIRNLVPIRGNILFFRCFGTGGCQFLILGGRRRQGVRVQGTMSMIRNLIQIKRDISSFNTSDPYSSLDALDQDDFYSESYEKTRMVCIRNNEHQCSST